jgi:DNA (cytosine-5)-methyltransferase 1
MAMKHLDLFSGIGGFALAARWAGIETVAFCEIDSFCKRILGKNFPNVPIYHDIKTFNYQSKVDILTAGFPCQPFSVAGKKKGKQDDRYLWPELLRIIKKSKPSWIIIENVPGVVGMELDNMLFDLDIEMYKAETLILPACAANAPHRRDRVWIIAHDYRKRCDCRMYFGEDGHLQENIIGNIKALQQEWKKLKPIAWETCTAKDWLQINADFGGTNDGLPYRLDRLKSLGNAIVPQVVYPILAMIKMIHDIKD